ncbi:MAG TPA: hypothetical protein VES96_05395 [Nitrospiraceae bacterium]|nr:hypothetical protein [Nitrospiraceae bacterium]
MSDASEQAVRQAINILSQSDPLIKLIQEVKLGRMKPTDAGLRAITEAWLNTYKKVLGTPGLDRTALLRLDPSPRLGVLIDAGIVPADHAAVTSLRAVFEKSLSGAATA